MYKNAIESDEIGRDKIIKNVFLINILHILLQCLLGLQKRIFYNKLSEQIYYNIVQWAKKQLKVTKVGREQVFLKITLYISLQGSLGLRKTIFYNKSSEQIYYNFFPCAKKQLKVTEVGGGKADGTGFPKKSLHISLQVLTYRIDHSHFKFH